jgi:hypothetical protein
MTSLPYPPLLLPPAPCGMIWGEEIREWRRAFKVIPDLDLDGWIDGWIGTRQDHKKQEKTDKRRQTRRKRRQGKTKRRQDKRRQDKTHNKTRQ